MIQVSWALEISFYLGLLNYVLGTLLLGSPLPFPSIKRLGSLMIKDSFAVWILASSMTLILNLVHGLRALLGLSWDSFFAWVAANTAAVASNMVGIKSLPLGSYATYLSPIISRITSILSTTLASLIALQLLGLIISRKAPEIVALGILLYSIPMGFFKRAGALLIAGAVVLSLGLPALPAFVEYLSSSVRGSSVGLGGLGQVTFWVRDLTGGALGSSILMIYSSPDKRDQSLVAEIPTDARGAAAANATDQLVGRKLYFSLEAMGWRFHSSTQLEIPRSCAVSVCSFNVTVEGILVSDSPYIYVHLPPALASYVIVKDPEEGVMNLSLDLRGGTRLVVTAPSSTSVSDPVVDGAPSRWDGADTSSWQGVPVVTYWKTLEGGNRTILIRYFKGAPPEPSLRSSIGVGDQDLQDLLAQAVLYLFLLFVFPTTYITLMGLATYSLARFLERGSR